MQLKRYYKIGISGHRDLLPSQMEIHFSMLKDHLLKLKRDQKETELLILTSLAEGADRLIAQVALSLDISYDVILPMPESLYMQDFSHKSQEEFLYYLRHAHAKDTIQFYAANTYSLISKPSIYRDFQYRQVGRHIVDMADEMIIMTNGIENGKMGGTNDIASYAQSCDKIINTIWCDRLCA